MTLKPFSLVATADINGATCESCGQNKAALYVVFEKPTDSFAVCSPCAEVVS